MHAFLLRVISFLALLLAGGTMSWAAGPETIELPAPDRSGGKPLMAALNARQSTRSFSSRPVPRDQLSNLLWAAFGINRTDPDHRTAPSAMNHQEIDLYVALAEGLYLYEAKPHRLRRITETDARPLTGGNAAIREAPAALILVADHARMPKAKPADRDFFTGIGAGYISQNVYLYCASAGLATVVHELDRAKLARAMQLRPEQRIVIAQTFGFPGTSRERSR